jgi:succinyl-CoA synthetase alpha subunit
MGHAGAIISGGSGKASDKIAALTAAGVTMVPNIGELGQVAKRVMGHRV